MNKKRIVEYLNIAPTSSDKYFPLYQDIKKTVPLLELMNVSLVSLIH